MLEKLTLRALELLPKNAVSRAFGAVSDLEFPPTVQSTINRTFARFAGIDLGECDEPESFGSLNAFFTRPLRQGARQVASTDPATLVSPVDGLLSTHGKVVEDTLIQAKGREYSLVDLLDSGREAAAFRDGYYATIYLSPRDYHRIHSPTSGRVVRLSYVPGHLFPVNPFAVRNVDELFAVNERLITYLDNPELGHIAVVKVGATCVGRIGVTYDEIRTNQSFRRRRDIVLDEPVAVDHGDELGVFNLGSTVIVLVADPDFDLVDGLDAGQKVRMGQLLGSA